MPTGYPVQVRLSDSECDALDLYRRKHKNPPSRAQAVRGLMRDALGVKLRSIGIDPDALGVGPSPTRDSVHDGQIGAAA
jgi:hypothetical protein